MRRLNLNMLTTVWLLAAAPGIIAAEVEIKSEGLCLKLSAEGRPIDLSVGEEHYVQPGNPGTGFHLKSGKDVVRFNKVSFENNVLHMSSEKGDSAIELRVAARPRYLAFFIEKLINLPVDYESRLLFQIGLMKPGVKAVPLDFMTVNHSNPGQVLVEREALWERSACNPRGSFAIYVPHDDADEDEILYDIWVNEGVTHPKTEGAWTAEKARTWMSRWIELNSDVSHLNIVASNIGDLLKVIPYAKRMDARAIYLWPIMWRGEYWLKDRQNDGVNPDLFPAGVADLQRFANTLRDNGLRLKLHYLSGNIGEYDPEFCGSKPDRRLASWGRGTLVESIVSGDRIIKIRPEANSVFPRIAGRTTQSSPRALPEFFNIQVIRIDDELIQVGRFQNTDQAVWTLEDCRRGQWATKAVAHSTESQWAGLLRPYGQDFVPDNNSELLEIIARRWAELNNRLQTTAANFDGFENHSQFGVWGSRKFATLVYQNLDHPVTASTSNGRPPDCFFEYRFNCAHKILGDELRDDAGKAVLMLDHPSRPATSLADVNQALCRAAASAVRSFDVASFDVKGVPIETLREHGQTFEILDLVKKWKRVSWALSPAQRLELKPDDDNSFRLPGAGHHPRNTTLWNLEGEGIASRLVAERTLVSDDFTPLWQHGQEHGEIAPRVYLKAGESIELNNPDPAEFSGLTLRILPAFDANSKDNIDLMPILKELKSTTQTQITADSDGINFRESNETTKDICHETDLPSCLSKQSLNISANRGLGLEITGDGSGALLVLSIGSGQHRDYVVPVNFQGTRRIEVPNGEHAWALKKWGWQFEAGKWFNYAAVRDFRMGLGCVPAGKTVNIRVKRIQALREIGSSLHNPSIQLGEMRFDIQGDIPANQILFLNGDGIARVYTANWRETSGVKAVMSGRKTIGKGPSLLQVNGAVGVAPWIEAEIQVRTGKVIEVKN